MTPPATPSSGAAAAPSPPARRGVTRDDLLRLGQSGRPWEFLPIVEQALRLAPEDPGLLLLAAANFAKVGLRTAAAERLAAMPAPVRADAGVRQLAAAVERMPDDRIGAAERIATCRGNAAVVCGRVPEEDARELGSALATWAERTETEEWFRCADGNIARRAGDGPGWANLWDAAGSARGSELPGGDEPVTVEGLDPPWLAQRMIQSLARREDGFWRPVRVVEPELGALCAGLACADLRAELAQERVRLFIGPRAAERLGAECDERAGLQIAGPVMVVGRSAEHAAAARTIGAACDRQSARMERLLAEIGQLYGARGRQWWARRYAEAIGGGGPPLRVLIPTYRHSTFVRHSAADLGSALRAIGCEPHIMMEPDDWSRFAVVGYLETVRRIEPDLIVVINYTRRNLGVALPAQVPYVCWIQDAMGHLFTEEAGSGQTELDFVVGHLHPALFSLFKYPRGRTLPTPVVVSETKFHDGPVEPALADRLACEIAYAGNQSETPEALRDRLIAESAASAASVRAIGAIFERVRAICGDESRAMAEAMHARLESAVREELDRAGVRADDKLRTQAMNLWAKPLADRVLRHQTLAWAADAAETNGWRLKIFGRGWERHPTLARYARGVLEHGDELRASYRCAKVHLHASASGWLHQRIMECALSGGYPLCRLRRDDLAPVESWAFRSLIEGGTPWLSRPATRETLFLTANNPVAMEAGALMQRFGIAAPMCWGVPREWMEDQTLHDGGMPMDRPVAWLLGDLAETGFWSPETLTAAVRKAIERPAWRENVVRGIAGRVQAGLTSRALAARMLGTIRASLESADLADRTSPVRI